jgi:hypothetical protein
LTLQRFAEDPGEYSWACSKVSANLQDSLQSFFRWQNAIGS